MRVSLPRLSVVQLQRRSGALALLIAVAVLLELAAGTGLTYLAGFDNVRAAAGRFDGFWLFVLVGALLVSIVGYYLAYQGIFRVEGGPRLSGSQMRAVVAAGFGGFLAHGGGALDQYALEAAGAEEADAKARVAALGGMEHGVLAIGGCAAAVILLASGRGQPLSRMPSVIRVPVGGPEFSPGVVLPVPGMYRPGDTDLLAPQAPLVLMGCLPMVRRERANRHRPGPGSTVPSTHGGQS